MARDAHTGAVVRAHRLHRALVVAALFGGCADAPITPDLLESDGQLKTGKAGGGQSAFAAGRATPHRASVVQLDALLASAPTGSLEGTTTFAPDVGTVHLHVRADGLEHERDVVFRWTHGEHTLTVPGGLVPSSQYVLAASIDVQPDQTGLWRVEVVTAPSYAGEIPEVLVSREFLILSERPSE
jgi:hypothetical protein